jgi:hypothetical protein
LVLNLPKSILVLALLLGGASCAFPQSMTPADSAISGNAYINYYFRFRYEFTASWIPLTNATTEQVHEFNLDRIATSCLHPDHDPRTIGAQDLLTLLRKLPKTMQYADRYAAILVVAEKLPPDSAIQSGTECSVKLTEYLEESGYSLLGKAAEMQIGEHSFTRRDLKGNLKTGAVYESLIYTTIRGYALGIILVAPNQQMLETTANTLRSLSFF